jgi:hypothetical protein
MYVVSPFVLATVRVSRAPPHSARTADVQTADGASEKIPPESFDAVAAKGKEKGTQLLETHANRGHSISF